MIYHLILGKFPTKYKFVPVVELREIIRREIEKFFMQITGFVTEVNVHCPHFIFRIPN